jgi:hypothetical protein
MKRWLVKIAFVKGPWKKGAQLYYANVETDAHSGYDAMGEAIRAVKEREPDATIMRAMPEPAW